MNSQFHTRYLPHADNVVFYDDRGHDIGVMNWATKVVSSLTGRRPHPRLAEVAEVYCHARTEPANVAIILKTQPGGGYIAGPANPSLPSLPSVKSAVPSVAVVPSVLSAERAAAVDRADSYHRGFRVSAQQVAVYAFLAGRELNAIKESLNHGEWMPFFKTNLPNIPLRSANNYMRLADQIGNVANLPTVGALKLLENGRLPEDKEKKVIAAFAEATDGKRLTELYRDAGIIREKKPQVHTPPKPLTAEEHHAAEIEQLLCPIHTIIECCGLIRARGDLDNAKLSPADWNQLLNEIVPVAKLARSLRRKLKGSRKGKKK